ncbi:hypothetical protein AXG93_488s1100 [Marchantia polymorpha subsp. ruderalis]|uniref:Uncharacterized protein n=1 Tax=Marchantia polymorpha subsp. ruderalis TaxID=1480154 RepID=A0A176W4U9_MARPO|nr:hypothetical protein AXG93_488s1100 [Marchantia polymorpha subsp. ruderalis]
MELDVPRHGARVAEGQGPTYARISTAPGAMGSQRLGAGAGKMRGRRRTSKSTDEDETPTCTPPAQPRAEGESLAARVPRKRRWEGGAEKGQQREAAALKRKRPLIELCSRPKRKARRLLLPASSAETGRATEGRNSPSSGEDERARTAERSADLPAPKARTPSAEARRPSGQEKQHAAPMNVPVTDRCFASEQVQFDDSTSDQAPSAQQKSEKELSGKTPSGQEPSAEAPSAQGPSAQGTSGQQPSDEPPLAQPPLAQPPLAVDAFGADPM